MMKFRLLLSFALLFSLAQSIYAQKDKDIQVIDFGEDDHGKGNTKEYKGLIVKTNPLSFIFGAQWLELEKETNDYLSLQIGAGVRFGSLVGISYDQFIDEISETSYSCDDGYGCDDYYDFTYRKDKIGAILSFSPRFFYESDGYDGAYIAPILRYSRSNYKVQKIEEGASDEIRLPNAWQKEFERDIDLVVQYGYQSLHPKLTTELFIGLGVRFNKSKRQDIGYSQGSFDQYFNGERQLKQNYLRLEMGIRVGFQL